MHSPLYLILLLTVDKVYFICYYGVEHLDRCLNITTYPHNNLNWATPYSPLVYHREA